MSCMNKEIEKGMAPWIKVLGWLGLVVFGVLIGATCFPRHIVHMSTAPDNINVYLRGAVAARYVVRCQEREHVDLPFHWVAHSFYLMDLAFRRQLKQPCASVLKQYRDDEERTEIEQAEELEP